MSLRHAFRPAILVSALLLSATSQLAVAEAPVPAGVTGALEWRQLGPFRGGWATMAAGVPSKPDTFYIGTAGGGVWKTDDVGRVRDNVGAFEAAGRFRAI